MSIQRNPTRSVRIGNVTLGNGNPIAVQSMTATKTQNVDATVAQAEALRERGAGVVRIAVDSDKDAGALAAICRKTFGWRNPSRPTSTKFVTTRDICITINATNLGRTKFVLSLNKPLPTIVQFASA